ncbi:hypothetical protein RHMOL_Rhmol02G0233700 [Rhododendron molle]|uniref:Uncharacterized protein n=1 Tax=Rhododendron molle TaxID=49168 RepID=A0ACC0PUP0_RHOML|nr:hypothetical protein RHMOL_Rhmol02G0233700 [Rhododendron molle]
MEDRDTELLARAAANHLYLAQFEPFRATLLSLRARNPDLARAILQTLVSLNGRLDNILWSPHSCPSPSLLAYLSTLELLQFNHDDAVSSLWRFDPDSLRLRVEFSLYVETITSKLKELGGGGGSGESESLLVLGKLAELGFNRLRPDSIGVDERENGGRVVLEGEELMRLRSVVLENAVVFDVLCGNIQKQVEGGERGDDSGLAITLRREGECSEEEEEDVKLLKLVQRSVQIVHLDSMRECLGKGDAEGAVSHIRFLHLGYEVEETEYRMVLQDLLKRVLSTKTVYGDTWLAMRDKLLLIYGEALSSNCTNLVQMIQSIHDDFLAEEIEMFRVADNNQISPPLEHLQSFMANLEPEINPDERASSLRMATFSCMRDMYHYARVSGLHVLECVMDTALSAVKREQLLEASTVLSLFPRLQPLVAAMGWDLLCGKTTARRKLMQLLWTSKSQVLRLEESSLYGSQADEVSCIEHLCDSLCYQLDLASFVACVNSGRSWSSKTSILLSRKEPVEYANEDAHLDPFVENFVLERLSVQSALRVLFDVVPGIKFQDAIELISMQPMASTVSAWKRMRDIELMHMRYALEFAVLALGAMERSLIDETGNHHQVALSYLKDLRNHLEAVNNIPRKIFLVNIIISLLHMDDLSVNPTHCVSHGSHLSSSTIYGGDHADHATFEGGNKTDVSFIGMILDILHQNLPSSVLEQENGLTGNIPASGVQVLDWRISNARRFVEDWEWRLSILQRLVPLSERQWRWKETLTVLRAAPSKLLNLCMQRAKYDIGEEAVHRFQLPPEDKATLELAEWVDGAFRKASVSCSTTIPEVWPALLGFWTLVPCPYNATLSTYKGYMILASYLTPAGELVFLLPSQVEDAVSRAADGTSAVQELDFSSLRSQLGPLAAILLCVDVATCSAKSATMSQKLLDQAMSPNYNMKIAQVMLSEIYPGGSPKIGSTYWDQIHEVGIISVTRRVLKRSLELLEQDKPPALQAILSGDSIVTSSKDLPRQGHRERALSMLHQMIEDAHKGKRQFLSGKLHNLARAVADEETERDSTKGEGAYADSKSLNYDKDAVLGLGLRAIKQASPNSAVGENIGQPPGYDVKDSGRRLFRPLSAKTTTYLSQFILHIAAIGDIVDGTDTTHDFNYFSLVYEWPKDLLTRLVFERGSTDAAGKVAEIMFADFVHEVISACVPPVYPPRSGHAWACIPVTPTSPRSFPESKLFSPTSKDAKPNSYSRSSAIPGIALYPLQLDIVKHLVKLSPVRAVLACVFGSGILYHGSDSSICSSFNDGLLQTPDEDRWFYEFALDQSERFPTLNRWIQMQTNLHRVSEVAVSAELHTDDGMVKAEPKTAIKRYRELESDNESEVDDIAGNTNLSTTLPDLHSPVNAASDHWHESPKSEVPELDTRVFLSFDWENEGPYERAVERLEKLQIDFLWGGLREEFYYYLLAADGGPAVTDYLKLEGDMVRWDPTLHSEVQVWELEELMDLFGKLSAVAACLYLGSWELDAQLYSDKWEVHEVDDEKRRLIDEGKLMDALALSDRCLRNGASDRLLQLLIERGEESNSVTGQSQGYAVHNMWSNSWQYCLRLKDKQLAARLALKYLHRWELDAALDVITMCSCHLPESYPAKNEVVQMRQALLRYKHILCADDHYSSWQEVEAECKEDPEGLALRLAGKGAVSAALEVAESAGLSIELRRELQGRQLVKLLTADPLNGGGPAEASRFLSSLRDSDDALPVAMGAMQLLPNLRSKQLLVHFFLKRRDGNLSELEVGRLNSWALGLRVLSALPLPWQQRCSSLHEHPHLILEVLLMRKQLQSASLILKEFPSLRDNSVTLTYAAKAIAVSISSPSREPRVSVSVPKGRQKTRTGMPTKSSFTNSLSNLQKEARRAFSWTPRNNGDKTAPREAYKKRKSSGLAPSEKVTWEAMTGIQEDRVSLYPTDGQERFPPVSIAEEWMLTGDPNKDDGVRFSHRYESAPDIILFKALLSLCSDELTSGKGALSLCINQMRNVLSSQQLPENASMETIGRAYHATETFVQGLIFSKSQLRKVAGGSDLSSNSERGRDADDSSSDAGSSSMGSQSTDELSEVLSQADIWLGRAELLQSLLGSGIAASLDDIADQESSAHLRDRLIVDERYSMAVYTCRKCRIDVFPVWNAWGHALIRMEHYAQARVKFNGVALSDLTTIKSFLTTGISMILFCKSSCGLWDDGGSGLQEGGKLGKKGNVKRVYEWEGSGVRLRGRGRGRGRGGSCGNDGVGKEGREGRSATLRSLHSTHTLQLPFTCWQALQLHKGDPAAVILEIINTIEGSPPVDVSAVRSMYEHLARSAPAILDDSLSADSYLNVLYMPSTFPRSERSRRSQESESDNFLRSFEFEDGPRSNLDSVRYLECVNYLQEYACQNLLGFMFRHGHYKDACLLFFPPNAVPPPPQPSSLIIVTSSSSPQRPDPLATDYGTIDDLCDLCIGYGAMPVLEEVLSTRISSAAPQDVIFNQYTAAALARICVYCELHKHFNYLYRFQVLKKDHVAAGLCCIQLFMNSSSQEEAIKHLENAKMHFDDGLSARYKIGDSTKLVTKGIRGKSASEKLSEEGLVKFSARVAIQVDVVRSFNDADGPPWKYSLFGNPNDPETFRRRCKIGETLIEKNFDLAFQVIYEFNLPAVDIYAGVAASLAERKRGGQLTEFFRNIKGTIDDDDMDQVLGAAINVYANKHKERPDRLIDMLNSSHRRVLACVVCGRLKSAFQIASRSGSVADVQYVAHQALHANALPVLDMCKQWLAQYM